MARVCPRCGASSPQEARYCRLCGTPLGRATTGADESLVSPAARTVPLKGDSRPTDGLTPEDPRRAGPDTSRVAKAEIEELLRREQIDRAVTQHESDPPEYITIPTTHSGQASSPLTTSKLVAPAEARAENATASAAQTIQRRPRARRVWTLAAVAAIVFVTIAAGLLVYLLARNRASSDSKTATTTPASSQGNPNDAAVNSQGAEGAQPTSSVSGQQQIAAARPEPSATREERTTLARNHTPEGESATSNETATLNMSNEAAAGGQPKPNAQAAPVTDHYKRGMELWGQNRQAALQEFRVAAGSNPDAYYYLGLNLAEGRDPRSMQRAELVAALQYFQLAQRGQHHAEAAQYAERLGREYDRRRNKGSSQ